MAWTRAPKDEVQSLTSARLPHSQDLGGRQRRYLISMSIRTACLVLAVVADGPLRWVLIAGAVLLPYVAVVMANAGRESGRAGPGGRGPVPPGPDSPLMIGDAPRTTPER